ncbi:MAG: beta-ketoacyl-[acyl-carrier-protein] synthase family protein [Planctomycetia bacterium]|nr:beta-ketoacyl-[acyl-carrier-protein] synthase family protein [Planctomycetia bacterium]
MKRRVVVTGLGCVTPLGANVDLVWKRLLAGESAVDYITRFDASSFPTKIAAEVKNWDLSHEGEDPARWVNQGLHTQFAIGAGKQAVKDSGIMDISFDPLRFGVYTGGGEGQQDFGRFARMMVAGIKDGVAQGVEFSTLGFIRDGLRDFNQEAELEQEPNMPAAHLAAMFNAQGPNSNCLTACAASVQAIGEATEIIRRGECDLMLSGGAHSMIHPMGVMGFNLLTALSTNNENPKAASRPFDRLRDGFVLGEGSVMCVLEEYEHAKKRGAKIYGEVAGYGSTADAFRITDTHPDGRGAISCLEMALRDAECNIDEIDYINAHGTSTSVNDKVETLAIKKVFGERAYKIPVSSTKSMIGHMIAAAGASEMMYCLLAMRDGVVPPTINYENPDPLCDLDYVPNVCREVECNCCITNSFGFGGQNVSILVKKV